MEDWIKQFSDETQKELYARAYDYMSYRKAYYDENLTVENALEKIAELCYYELQAKLDARTENKHESV